MQQKLGLKQLNMFNLQIRQAQTIIEITGQELILIDSNIIINLMQIQKFENKLATLKNEYSQVIYTLAKRNYYGNIMLYLLASESFKQFFRRLNYLSQYRRTRKIQIANIHTTNYKLSTYRKHLQVMRQAKQNLLKTQIENINQLDTLKRKETQLLKQAAQNINRLQTEIQILNRQKQKIDSLINVFAIQNPPKIYAAADSILNQSQDFPKYQHQLSWPIAAPVVLQKFGRQRHPVLKNIWLDNLGIKIKSEQSETVNNIFSGKIILVRQTYDSDYIVIVQHGRYFTVYSNLERVMVEVGMPLATRKPIGLLGKDGELDFQIWLDNQKLDPEEWLKRE